MRFSCSPCAAAARRSAPASSVGEVKVVSRRRVLAIARDLLEQPAVAVGSLNEANER